MIDKPTLRQIVTAYPNHMLRLLSLNGGAIREIFKSGLALPYCSANILILGLFYGISAIYFSQLVLAPHGVHASGAGFNPLLILLVGGAVAFLMHGAAALFLWVFCRGIGGNSRFSPIYMGLGAAAIVCWPLSPGLAALQAGYLGTPLAIFTLGAALNAAAVIYVAIRTVSGLSHLKMSIAALVTLIYIGSFMYLWT